MADDDSSDSKENQNPVAKEKEMFGVPMSTWYSVGIVAVGTVSLITALKVLLPPNFQLFPQQPNSPPLQLPNFNLGIQQPQQPQQYQYQPQPQQGNGNAMNTRQDNSVEEYEVYDESRGLGPKSIDVGVGRQQQQQYEEEEEEDGNANSRNQAQNQIQTDDRAFRTTESVIKNNSGIQITESPDVVNSRRRFMKSAYSTSGEYNDPANLDYE